MTGDLINTHPDADANAASLAAGHWQVCCGPTWGWGLDTVDRAELSSQMLVLTAAPTDQLTGPKNTQGKQEMPLNLTKEGDKITAFQSRNAFHQEAATGYQRKPETSVHKL